MSAKERKKMEEDIQEPQNDDERASSDAPRRGRPPNERVTYLKEHPRYKTHHRIVRSMGHNTLPSIVGPFFPRRDDPDIRAYYCASMVALLKPWRHLCTLKGAKDTWEDAFGSLLKQASRRDLDVLSGIQHYYDSRSAAERECVKDPKMDLDIHDGDSHLGQTILASQIADTEVSSAETEEVILRIYHNKDILKTIS
jgi:hypothetical protein